MHRKAAERWHAGVIEEFRVNEGRVSGPFEGAPTVLVHHVGRRTGETHVSPMMFLPGEEGVIHVFASKAGALTHPDWFHNLIAAGSAEIEVGTDRYPGFAEYAEKTAGIRTMPVLRLTRTA